MMNYVDNEIVTIVNGLIVTPLPIAYLIGNKIVVKTGLDPEQKDKVWGVKLPSGVIVSVKFCNDNWLDTQSFVNKLVCDDKSGRLPFSNDFDKEDPERELKLFRSTIVYLVHRGVDVDFPPYSIYLDGYIWVADEYDTGDVTFDYNENVAVHVLLLRDKEYRLDSANGKIGLKMARTAVCF